MARNAKRSIERLRERARDSTEIAVPDREAILACSDRIALLGSEYSDLRHEFYLMRLVKIAEEVGGLAAALEDREAAEDIVRWIHGNYDHPETNRDYRIALRMFGELMTEGDGKPPSVSWVPGGYDTTYDPAPEPANMLRWEDDVLPMISACENHRDRALIALAFDAGPRGGELESISVGDVSEHPYGMQVTLAGKTGKRTVTLVPSVPYLQLWLTVHPGRETADAPLWSRLDSSVGIDGDFIREMLREVAGRAGITRPVTPTNFRKSSASFYASAGVSQAHLEAHHGWQRGSRVAARYVSVFGDASHREIARVHGVDLDAASEPGGYAPLTCECCQNETPPTNASCIWCGGRVDAEAAVEAEANETTPLLWDHPGMRERLAEMIGDGDSDAVDPGAIREVQPLVDAMTDKS